MTELIRLRQVALDDARQLFVWRNESETREASFKAAPIAYEDHVRWFEQKMHDRNTLFLIAVDRDNRDVGYARLDLGGEAAEINLSVDKRQRGKGIGTAVVQAVAAFAIGDLKVCHVVARIKPGNTRAQAAFRRAGFDFAGHKKMGDTDFIKMVYSSVKP